MKYTIDDVICVMDVVRGKVDKKDIVGKDVYSSDDINSVLKFANRNDTHNCSCLLSAENNCFSVRYSVQNLNYIIIKKEPKKVFKPFDFSNKEHMKILMEKAWVIDTESNMYKAILIINDSYIFVGKNSMGYSPKTFLEKFTFIDGTPCGIEEEVDDDEYDEEDEE